MIVVVVKQLNFALSYVLSLLVTHQQLFLFLDSRSNNTRSNDHLLALFVQLDVWNESAVDFQTLLLLQLLLHVDELR